MRFSGIPRSYRTSMRRTSGMLSMRSRTTSSLFSSLKSGGRFKLKSGSLLNNSSISRKSNKTSLSKIIRSDIVNVSAVSSKVSSGLTKEYVSALETQAKKDAQAGAYGKDGKMSELRAEQMKKYISPDRDSAISQVSKLLSAGSFQKAGANRAKLSGLPYTATVTKGRNGTTAEIFDEYGEKFASYDGKTGEWKKIATKAEAQFQTASSSIFGEAYRAAQSGLRSSSGNRTQSSLDFRA
ncbi:hypothetical protein D1159_07410 [Pseudoflavonifractor sp. 524-17]|uniref:hypothetical protein n=1 Tax=Pseudoflavonifractor sp. 524-17 TaxID=2304577 RepID=UPI00137A159A|nr:hypothetical protein [Pseudoflavonifractor sp. 524-17]NCE64420.1 hypothetical protein [Pseudoflavonifractor sp. 524-17]